MCLIVESAGDGQFTERHVAGEHEMACPIQASLDHIEVRRLAKAYPKAREKCGTLRPTAPLRSTIWIDCDKCFSTNACSRRMRHGASPPNLTSGAAEQGNGIS